MTPRANVLTPHAARAVASRATQRTPATPLAPPVPCSQLRTFVDALEQLGFDVASLRAPIGLRRAELDDPDATIPGAAFNAVIGLACEQRRLPNLGAHLAAVTPIGAYPLLDYLVVTTDNVGGALEQLVRYFHLADAPVQLAIAEETDVVRLLVHRPTTTFVADYETSIIVHHLREETERRLKPLQVSLEHEPESLADLERLFDCPVRAPSSWTGIEFRGTHFDCLCVVAIPRCEACSRGMRRRWEREPRSLRKKRRSKECVLWSCRASLGGCRRLAW